MSKRIIIIHFQPIEYYPPILNLINYLVDHLNDYDLFIITTEPQENIGLFKRSCVNIQRYKPILPNSNVMNKFNRYLNLYLGAFLKLISKKPSVVIYYETLSSLPAICYRKLRKFKLFAHYHEIVTLDELSRGRMLNNLLNKIEARNYKGYNWISQTNNERLNIFSKQYGLNNYKHILKCLPNYPPEFWLHQPKRYREEDNVIRFLHVGAISTKGMYIKEFLREFGLKPGFSIDFYSHNFSKEVVELINKYSNCTLKGSIDYKNIVQLKGLYDVGLVLYKGESLNFTFNAPNKIFEYLALDLDVWCSDKLITAKEYKRINFYPKMILVDYSHLSEFDIEKAISRTDIQYLQSEYTCESVYHEMLFYLKN